MSASLLEQLGAPADVWREFLFICSVPHGSGNVGPLRDAIIKRIEGTDLEHVVEAESGNLLITKRADPGWESVRPICLQAHLDMVCVKDDDVEHDFSTDSIRPRIDGTAITATGTTLGADNGIGMAACLALVQDRSFKSGTVEVLLTVDEETTMSGAERLTPDLLTARTLVNVDYETAGVMVVGSSSGFECYFLPQLPLTDMDAPAVAIAVSGLTGGHSGLDAHKQRANAVKISAQLLDAAVQKGFALVSMSGGTYPSVIPTRMDLVVTGPNAEELAAELEALSHALTAECAEADPSAEIRISVLRTEPRRAVTLTESRRFADFLLACPSGILRWAPGEPRRVETSVNLAFVQSKAADGALELEIGLHARSDLEAGIRALTARLDALARLSGYDIDNVVAPYSGWRPNPSSPLAASIIEASRGAGGQEWTVEAVHAGLECGAFFAKYPDLDAVSIGPTIHHFHTSRECCEIATVPPFYEAMRLAVRGMK